MDKEAEAQLSNQIKVTQLPRTQILPPKSMCFIATLCKMQPTVVSISWYGTIT
jgi:hypothetical protein